MTPPPNQPYTTVEEYLELDRHAIGKRYEYLDGEIYMQAGGSANHSAISANIIAYLRNALRGSPCFPFTSDMRVRLTKTRYVLPDVVVSCDQKDRGDVDLIESPRVVVEVLSPSTKDLDRDKKFVAYRAHPTIQEYIMVNTRYKAVEIYRRQKKNLWTYQVLEIDDYLECTSIGVRMPVFAIYEDTLVPDPDHPSDDDNQPA